MSRVLLTNRNYNGRRLKRIGCALLIFLSPLLVGYIIMFLYANYGGLWAAKSLVPPIPQNSRFIANATFIENGYDGQTDFYTTSLTITEVRDWFDSFIRMVPDEMWTEEHSGNHYYSDNESFRFSTEYMFLHIVGNITRRIPNKSMKYDLIPECFLLDVVAPTAINESPFRDQIQEIESLKNVDEVVFVVKTCWPNWE